MRRGQVSVVVVCLLVAFSACKKSPAAPAKTRVAEWSGSLDFGNVKINTTATRGVSIINTGNDTLTVTSLSTTVLGGNYSADWISGTIPPGGSQFINIFFRPTEARTYNGAVIIQANQTSGFNSTPVNGTGVN